MLFFEFPSHPGHTETLHVDKKKTKMEFKGMDVILVIQIEFKGMDGCQMSSKWIRIGFKWN